MEQRHENLEAPNASERRPAQTQRTPEQSRKVGGAALKASGVEPPKTPSPEVAKKIGRQAVRLSRRGR